MLLIMLLSCLSCRVAHEPMADCFDDMSSASTSTLAGTGLQRQHDLVDAEDLGAEHQVDRLQRATLDRAPIWWHPASPQLPGAVFAPAGSSAPSVVPPPTAAASTGGSRIRCGYCCV